MPDVPHIACVDDDLSIGEALVIFLKSHGFAAQAFPSAESFLQSAGMKDTWCLITDVRLPGMSGLQLQGRMLDAGIKIPIIFITAYPDEMIRSRAMEAGAVCFLRKPVTVGELLACIDSARARVSDERT
jgi:FixJ family two-component response regulator